VVQMVSGCNVRAPSCHGFDGASFTVPYPPPVRHDEFDLRIFSFDRAQQL
jgi:hypothetical protein